ESGTEQGSSQKKTGAKVRKHHRQATPTEDGERRSANRFHQPAGRSRDIIVPAHSHSCKARRAGDVSPLFPQVDDAGEETVSLMNSDRDLAFHVE
ncbi:MAG: hypothetical protein KDA52_23270, partial [Planctomycetaceae bacterium]|nr:hypothetical protein [Planctomycetaceae bacterium]